MDRQKLVKILGWKSKIGQNLDFWVKICFFLVFQVKILSPNFGFWVKMSQNQNEQAKISQNFRFLYQNFGFKRSKLVKILVLQGQNVSKNWFLKVKMLWFQAKYKVKIFKVKTNSNVKLGRLIWLSGVLCISKSTVLDIDKPFGRFSQLI